jgi:lipopolysaccharide/colanic/teichoic acid biosynthesis glycosyltransferase
MPVVRNTMFTTKQKIYLVFKRIIDIFGSLLGILLLSLLLLFCAFMVRITSKGPVILHQKRIGRNKQTFKMLKFRSMKSDAPTIATGDLTQEQQDLYVTKWGKIMRKTSWDELPQLFNILIGDMSFIGPRPGLPEEIEPELYKMRNSFVPSAFCVRPGLSGYSQVILRRSPDPDEKAKNDSFYVAHLSFWLDLKIFILSFLSLFGFNRGR